MFSLPAGTEMVHFPAFAPEGLFCSAHGRPGSRLGRFPHSDTPGSSPACGSPRLFAAYHVLRRGRQPRHPPSTLGRLAPRRPAAPFNGAPAPAWPGPRDSRSLLPRLTPPPAPESAGGGPPYDSMMRFPKILPARKGRGGRRGWRRPPRFCGAGAWAQVDSNHRPRAYQARALARLSYGPFARSGRWTRPGSNRRPPGCKPGALPAELRARPAPARRARRPWGPDGWETLRWEADLFLGPSRGPSLERR